MSSSDDKWSSDSAAYLRPRSGADAWSAEAELRGGVGSQRLLLVETTPAPTLVADELDLRPGHTVVHRQRLIELDGHPVEIASSWYPGAIAAGTALAANKKIRGGAVTLLTGLGHRIASVVEDVESRLPTDHEASALRLSAHEPVLVLTRLARDQGERPIEFSVMVTPGSERRLRYEMKVN
ncbi:UTRA domain-containing protein [Kitasatospora sp. NBC_00240]|uniref:GntR family transcriptional regulator n=1 Tax=Kitasatospora sp. NBC_00240 TaxID=2903567 RepID=UPI00224E2FB0|nr:UTRA domain-containing protein [Kitasatospora sp. NBC_00240]MCX5209783.1 UTRA domain-containing protein [Kitasatospora sp. NBC_00240]